MKERTPRDKLVRVAGTMKGVSAIVTLTIRWEGGKGEPRGLFLYSGYLLMCPTVYKTATEESDNRQEPNGPAPFCA